MLCFID